MPPPRPPLKKSQVAGAVFGNVIVDAILGPAEESYKVPADYRAFVDYSSSDYDRSDDPDSKVVLCKSRVSGRASVACIESRISAQSTSRLSIK
jgi:hypothetical protein